MAPFLWGIVEGKILETSYGVTCSECGVRLPRQRKVFFEVCVSDFGAGPGLKLIMPGDRSEPRIYCSKCNPLNTPVRAKKRLARQKPQGVKE